MNYTHWNWRWAIHGWIVATFTVSTHRANITTLAWTTSSLSRTTSCTFYVLIMKHLWPPMSYKVIQIHNVLNIVYLLIELLIVNQTLRQQQTYKFFNIVYFQWNCTLHYYENIRFSHYIAYVHLLIQLFFRLGKKTPVVTWPTLIFAADPNVFFFEDLS